MGDGRTLGLAEMPKPLERLSAGELKMKRCIGRVMTYALRFLTQRFVGEGFEWMLPVICSPSTDPLWPDPGASIEKRIEVEIYGKTVRTTLSMIIHKMVACSLVYPKLFILSPNLRIERTERAGTGVHAYEFTQLDFEIKGASSRGIRSLVEGAIVGLIAGIKRHLGEELSLLGRAVSLKVPRAPFKVYDKRDLDDRYGEDAERQLLFEANEPVWVTNVPREFYDYEDLERGIWDNYDLLLPQYGEVLSGARREWEHGKMLRKIERDKTGRENYELLLELAKEKRLKPSAGGGMGVERLVSWITGARHMGEVQPFPKIPGLVYDL